MASLFVDHFSTVADKLNAQIPISNKCPLEYMKPRIQNSFCFIESTPSEVYNLIASFPNKGCHPNRVPVVIFKCANDLLSPLISSLFNSSVEAGIFPELLKIGRITPIFKSGNRGSVHNFRPITTLDYISKIFEKLMNIRIVSFIEKYSLINPNQFGFRSGRSTSDALLEFLDHACCTLQRGHYLLVTYLDFLKAFDTVNLNILLSKLEHIGFRGVCGRWLTSYLCGRSQYVGIG